MTKEDYSGISWTYTQLFPNRDSYTLSDPTHFINNHRKLNYRDPDVAQINLDYLDLIEEISSFREQVLDCIVLGNKFSGKLIVQNKYRKSIFLKESSDIDILITETLRRMPESVHLMHEKDGKVTNYTGLNTGKAMWHSAVENYSQFAKKNFMSLIQNLNYEQKDYREFKKNFINNKTSDENHFTEDEYIDNIHFRLINLDHGYYELLSYYPKIQKITKLSVIGKLLKKVEQNVRFADNSYGIYFVSPEQKLYKVMPKD